MWPIASITKSFTAVSAFQLVQQGKLDLNKPIKEYLPYFSVSDKSASESINSDLCLKHASGLGRTGHQDRYREENYNPLIIRPQPNREHNIYATRKSLVENLHTAKLQSSPGQFFSYCNEDTFRLVAFPRRGICRLRYRRLEHELDVGIASHCDLYKMDGPQIWWS